MQQEIQPVPDEGGWERLAPVLDELVGQLSAADRDAVLLRFYRQMTYPELGSAFGITEEAARKRVNRAVEKLRKLAQKRGIIFPVATMAALLLTNAVQAAPPGLAAVSSAAALSGPGGIVSGSALSLAKGVSVMAMTTKAKVVVVLATLVLLAGTGGVILVTTFTGNAPERTAEVRPAVETVSVHEDRERIQGLWQVVSETRDGEPSPADYTLEIDTEYIVWWAEGQRASILGYALRSQGNSKWIELSSLEGPVTLRGSYMLDGDELHITYDESASVEMVLRRLPAEAGPPLVLDPEEIVRRARSASHLRIIGLGMHMYGRDHEWQFPPDIETAMRVAGWASPITSPFDEGEGPRFVFLRPDGISIVEMDLESVGTIVVGYDAAALVVPDEPQGTNVLFASGAVYWKSVREFEQALRESEEAKRRIIESRADTVPPQ